MADEKAAEASAEVTAPEIDVDTLPQEDFEKLKRGEDVPQKAAKEAPADDKAGAEDADDTDGADDKAAGKSGSVPHAKFHRANERAKAEAKAREAAEAKANLATQRMTELLEAMKPKAEPEVDPDVFPGDPEDYVAKIDWLQQREQRRIDESRQMQTQEKQRREADAFSNSVFEEAGRQFEEATEADPDFRPAYDAVVDSFRNEVLALGITGQAAIQEMQRLEASYIAYAHQHKIPIADLVKRLAKARGYTGRQAPSTLERTEQQARDDATGRFAKASAEADKAEALKKAARSLNGSGAAVDTGPPTPEDIVNMTDEEFEAFKKKYGGKEKSLAAALNGRAA